MKYRFAIVLFLCLVGACASRRDEAQTLVHNANWQWQTIPAGAFDLATAMAPGRQRQILWIYIEGDGRAFLTPSLPSSDPTPDDPVALRLALAQYDSYPAAYLARPCQYVLPDHPRGCQKKYWTDARYAPAVVDSLNRGVDFLKQKTGASHVVLVGYSGGGALAVLVAAKRTDIAEIITVAADLDLDYWTRHEGLTPLKGSLDPANYANAVAAIPQIHFTGELDKVVGPGVTYAFVRRLPADAPVQVREIPGFTHTCCWAEKWNQLLDER